VPTDPEYERQLRAARNQTVFRAVNENLRDFNDRFSVDTGTYAIACECADVDCTQMLEIGADDYRAVREHPRRFVVAAGHVYSEVEKVVDELGSCVVVEKVAKAGEYAEASATDATRPDL
jgi:hypothetical protein